MSSLEPLTLPRGLQSLFQTGVHPGLVEQSERASTLEADLTSTPNAQAAIRPFRQNLKPEQGHEES